MNTEPSHKRGIFQCRRKLPTWLAVKRDGKRSCDLDVQYASDDSVRVMSGQTADEGNRVLVGASVYGADCVFRLTVRPNVLTCQPPNQPLQLV